MSKPAVNNNKAKNKKIVCNKSSRETVGFQPMFEIAGFSLSYSGV
jgi:hypothetical protein